MDTETKKILDEESNVLDLVNHAGWKLVRGKLVERILELQNVSEYIDVIQTGNATKLLKEMKANKRAVEILFDWLREVEGTGQSAIENKPLVKSYIHIEE